MQECCKRNSKRTAIRMLRSNVTIATDVDTIKNSIAIDTFTISIIYQVGTKITAPFTSYTRLRMAQFPLRLL